MKPRCGGTRPGAAGSVSHGSDAEDDGAARAFTAAQLAAFLEAAAPSRLRDLFRLLPLTGLRIGEAIALRCDDVQDGRLRVARALGSRHVSMLTPRPGPTKGGRVRFVDLAADLLATLQHTIRDRPKEALRRGWRPVPPWLFVTTNGTPFSQHDVRKEFRRIMARAGLGGLPALTVHSFRHTFTTMHVEAGAALPWLQQQLGHASIKITMDLYAKCARLSDTAAADRLAARVLGSR